MDSTLHPLDYEALARETLDGGFTQSLDGFRPTRGFVVSTRPDAEQIIRHEYANVENVALKLYHYVIDHGHDLRHGYLLGAWRDGDRVVLDLVTVFEDRDDALRAALKNGQDAIYDIGAGEEIRLPEPPAPERVERDEAVREMRLDMEREVRLEEEMNADLIERYYLRGITPPDF